MQFRASLINSVAKTLYSFLTPDIVLKVAKMVIPDYNVYKRSGFRESIPIPPMELATQVSRDVNDDGLFLDLVETMIRVDQVGIMGRRYPLGNLKALIDGVKSAGFFYDAPNNHFYEDGKQLKTLGWNRLLEGNEYPIALLRLDIVGNSKLVRRYSKEDIRLAYQSLRDIVVRSVEKRQGRIWSWEGDGGLAAFHFGPREHLATCAGLEILHELFLYSRTSNPLGEVILLRVAVHSAGTRFSMSESELRKNDSVRKVIELESRFTDDGAMTLSSSAEIGVDRTLAKRFVRRETDDGQNIFNYAVTLEDI